METETTLPFASTTTFTGVLTVLRTPEVAGIGCAGIGVPASDGGSPITRQPPSGAPLHPASKIAKATAVLNRFIWS
jgi:hypothetical protein